MRTTNENRPTVKTIENISNEHGAFQSIFRHSMACRVALGLDLNSNLPRTENVPIIAFLSYNSKPLEQGGVKLIIIMIPNAFTL